MKCAEIIRVSETVGAGKDRSMNQINVTYNTGAHSPSIAATLCGTAILIIMIAAMWKIFTKAGKHGWAIFVPFYGNYCEFEIAFGNGWLFLLMFVPVVNFVVPFITFFKLAKAFGKGAGFAIGMIFLPFVFLPMLGFGNCKYIGSQ